jgi:hypothetical protein
MVTVRNNTKSIKDIFNALKFILLLIPLFFCFVSLVYAVDVTLQWAANTEPDLAGYRIFSHEEGQSYDYSNPSWEGTETYCTIYALDETKTYCFVVRAYDTEGFESGDSNVICREGSVWVTIHGTVTYDGTPQCAMVLANGQYMFSCAGNGEYELKVPLDANGEITLFSSVDGLAPFKQVLTPEAAADFDIEMEPSSPDSKMPTVTRIDPENVDDPPGWVKIDGSVSLDGTPLNAMVLVNGQYMFSNGDQEGLKVGDYELVVPLDPSGMITLSVFVEGLQPYKETFSP